MRYVCLAYVGGTQLDALTDGERAELRRAASACADELRRSGHLVSAEPLMSVRAATTLRVREGSQVSLDGPAVETAAQLDEVLVLEARDLNEAIRLAARHPAARLGGIEIRPVARTGDARHGEREDGGGDGDGGDDPVGVSL
jgi:hypothetical protein